LSNTTTPQNSIEPKTRSALIDFSLMLCVPLVVAIFIHGVSAIVTVAISVVTCAILLFLGKFLFKATATFKNSSPFVVGVSVALLLPPTAPWWMTVITAVFAMSVCVLPFGTLDKAPFAPAVASICFATLCWPELLFNYSSHSYSLSKMLSLGISIDDE
jgi:Na+-translocating ferredoxin:NAD+ oxidoreductase RnfD subunit